MEYVQPEHFRVVSEIPLLDEQQEVSSLRNGISMPIHISVLGFLLLGLCAFQEFSKEQ